MDHFVTPLMRRERAIERNLEERAAYAASVKAIATQKWTCAWSMAGQYLITLGGESGRLHDFTLPPEHIAAANVIAHMPKMLAYLIEAAKTDDDAQQLLNSLTGDA